MAMTRYISLQSKMINNFYLIVLFSDLRCEIELERLTGGLVSLVKVAEGGWKTVHLRGLGRERVGSDSWPGSSEYFNYRKLSRTHRGENN